MKKLLTFVLMIFSLSLTAQNLDEAQHTLQLLTEKYQGIEKYKVDVAYTFENSAMGFKNSQSGNMTVQGDSYRLDYGDAEVWVSDGRSESIGTKEEDHSQIIMFCAGENEEAVLEYSKFLSFYTEGHKVLSLENNILRLEPMGEALYVEAQIKLKDLGIAQIMLVDDMKSTYTFDISNFTTNTAGTEFTIDASNYAEKIDERGASCK